MTGAGFECKGRSELMVWSDPSSETRLRPWLASRSAPREKVSSALFECDGSVNIAAAAAIFGDDGGVGWLPVST